MFKSKEYWKNRYESGGTSGAGSSGRLAEFKIRTLNDFIGKHKVKSLMDIGSGDGFIAGQICAETYIGYDVSDTAVKKCSKEFENDLSRVFTTDWVDGLEADMSISMDVIFHLVEDEIFHEHIRRLFTCATKFVVIYSSDCVSEGMSVHYKDRLFSEYVEKNFTDWELLLKIDNPYPFTNDPENESNSDFYIYKRKK